jgi:hypothetical protein
VLAEGEDVLVLRSFKLLQRLDAAPDEPARDRRVSKSELVRQYLEAAVATDRANGDKAELLIPLADASRCLTGRRPRPHTAAGTPSSHRDHARATAVARGPEVVHHSVAAVNALVRAMPVS